MILLPAEGNVCQECAGEHEPEFPHRQESLYWSVHFKMKYGVSPTWGNAMAHCSSSVQEIWKRELRDRGVSPEQLVPNYTKRDFYFEIERPPGPGRLQYCTAIISQGPNMGLACTHRTLKRCPIHGPVCVKHTHSWPGPGPGRKCKCGLVVKEI